MNRLRLIFVALAMTVACLLSLEAKTRRAVVIGLGIQQDSSWRKINGDKDVPLVTDMLKANGFTDIKTLVNSEATKKNIMDALGELVSRSGKGDIIYIHFSGHGQRMTDLDGDEHDGWDETWIPYDAYRKYSSRDRGEKHISDDEVSMVLGRLRRKIGNEGTIAVVVDACHSGDSTRDAGSDDTTTAVRGVVDEFILPGKPARRRKADAEAWLTLSACRDYQLNQEYQGCGKLTHIMTNRWNSFRGMSDKDIHEIINKAMQTRKYKGPLPQNPGMSGTTGNVLSIIFSK